MARWNALNMLPPTTYPPTYCSSRHLRFPVVFPTCPLYVQQTPVVMPLTFRCPGWKPPLTPGEQCHGNVRIKAVHSSLRQRADRCREARATATTAGKGPCEEVHGYGAAQCGGLRVPNQTEASVEAKGSSFASTCCRNCLAMDASGLQAPSLGSSSHCAKCCARAQTHTRTQRTCRPGSTCCAVHHTVCSLHDNLALSS